MKKLLLSSAALLAIAATPALSADLPVPPVVPLIEPVVAPVFTWTGPYIGVSVGGYWGGGDEGLELCGDPEDVDFEPEDSQFEPGAEVQACVVESEDDEDVIFFEADDDGDEGGGLLANAHAGFNWQVGNFVLGAEGEVKFLFGDDDDDEEVDFLILEDETGPLVDDAEGIGTARFDGGSTDWVGLATLRGGGVFGDRNQVLAYLKGGLAFGDGDDGDFDGECEPEGGDNFACEFVGDGEDDDDWNVGWTLGGGLEYKLTQNFSIGAEYLYVDLGDDDNEVTLEYVDLNDDDEGEIEFSRGGDDNLHLFEVRATFHFGGPGPAAF